MEHQNNSSFPSLAEDSRFKTNSTVNPFQNPDNLSSGHELLREGKSCSSSRSRSTSAFQNFSDVIDFHLQKSVRPFQGEYGFRECQRGHYLVGKPERILLHNVHSRTTDTDSGRIRCIQHKVGCHSRGSISEWHLEQGSHSLSSHKRVGDVSRGECTSLLLPQNTRESCSGKMRQFNSRPLCQNQGGTLSFSLCDMALRILNWCP